MEQKWEKVDWKLVALLSHAKIRHFLTHWHGFNVGYVCPDGRFSW